MKQSPQDQHSVKKMRGTQSNEEKDSLHKGKTLMGIGEQTAALGK